jgi:hypothetical protein
MTKFLEMEEKAERQFWEFEKTRMKLEQEQVIVRTPIATLCSRIQ